MFIYWIWHEGCVWYWLTHPVPLDVNEFFTFTFHAVSIEYLHLYWSWRLPFVNLLSLWDLNIITVKTIVLVVYVFYSPSLLSLLFSRFLLQSLEDLDSSLRKLNSRLFVIRGQPTDVFPRLFKVTCSSVNRQMLLSKLYYSNACSVIPRVELT